MKIKTIAELRDYIDEYTTKNIMEKGDWTEDNEKFFTQKWVSLEEVERKISQLFAKFSVASEGLSKWGAELDKRLKALQKIKNLEEPTTLVKVYLDRIFEEFGELIKGGRK